MIRKIQEDNEKSIKSNSIKDLSFYLNTYDGVDVRCQIDFGKNNEMQMAGGIWFTGGILFVKGEGYFQHDFNKDKLINFEHISKTGQFFITTTSCKIRLEEL